MAEINVKNLSAHNISGDDLFNDSESFMLEISEDSEIITGGLFFYIPNISRITHPTIICPTCSYGGESVNVY